MINRVVLTMLVGGTALVPQPSIAAEAADPCTTPTIVGTDVDDHILGTDGPDVIDALGGNDVIVGLAGDDVICGGNGGDSLIGGAGNDRLYGQEHVTVLASDGTLVEWRPDILNGGAGDDYFDGGGLDPGGKYGGDFITFEDAPQGVSVYRRSAIGDGTDKLVGSSTKDNTEEGRWNIVGSPYSDFLGVPGGPYRGHGNTLVGGEGDDTLFPGYGNDTIVDGLADCECAPGLTVVGGGDDTLGGSRGTDTMRGGQGKDTMYGDLGDDHVWGGRGDDEISGYTGRDFVSGGAGDDHVDGDGGADRVRGGAGNDVVRGDRRGEGWLPSGSDNVNGGPGADFVLDYGLYWHDWLRGMGGNDVLVNSISARGERVFGGGGRDKAGRALEDRLDVRMICRNIEIDRTRGACT